MVTSVKRGRMSTDYGIRCVDCNIDKVPDNLKRYAIEDIFEAVPALVNLKKAADDASIGVLMIEVSTDCVQGFSDFLEWIVEHHQHKLVMVDEYGDIYTPKQKAA